MVYMSKALVRLVACFRMILRSLVQVLVVPGHAFESWIVESWTVEPSNLGTLPRGKTRVLPVWSLYIIIRDCLLLYKSPKTLGLCYLYAIV